MGENAPMTEDVNPIQSESLGTKRRRFLKQVAAGASGAVLAALTDPEVRAGTNATVRAGAQVAGEKLDEAKEAGRERWEGRIAYRLSEIPDLKQGEKLWFHTMDTPPANVDAKQEIFQIIPGVSFPIIVDPRNDEQLVIMPVASVENDGTVDYHDHLFNGSSGTDIFDNGPGFDDAINSIHPSFLKKAAWLLAEIPEHSKSDWFIILEVNRDADHNLVRLHIPGHLGGSWGSLMVQSQPQVGQDGARRYYRIDLTTTGLQDLGENLGKPVKPIFEQQP